jgi:D-lactate dehydrogenase (cytochrome)
MTVAATQSTPPSPATRRRFTEDDWRAVSSTLAERFGAGFQTGASIREQHGHTTTWIINQPPDGVVYAMSTQDVAFVVRTCAAHNVPIIPFGVGTSLEGHVNAPEGGVSIDLSRMNDVVAINAHDFDCVVQPGVTRKQLNALLRDQGLFFPIDPGADATMGGMAATRASGTNAVRYGTMENMIISLEAVMPNGRIMRTGQRARKSSAGYDLTSLLIGSEGTLGIITELTVRLFGIPEAVGSVAATFPSVAQASEAVIATIQYGVPVARIELLDQLTVRAVNAYSNLNFDEAPLLLVEFHGSETAVGEHQELFKAIVEDHEGSTLPSANSPEERNRIWQARHDAYWASLALRPGAKGLTTDICVPISQLATCIGKAQTRAEEEGFLAPIVGHVGDGNFHVLPLIDMDNDDEVARARAYVGWLNEMAIEAGGTCTGEHGIGQGKARYLRRELGEEAVDVMSAIKQALDPQNIMNPGKILPT